MAVKDRAPTNPKTANELYFDAALRHQVGVRRFSAGEVKRALKLLEKADRELVSSLRKSLAQLGGERSVSTERFKSLIKDLRIARAETMKTLRSDVRGGLADLVPLEIEFEQRMLSAALPVEIEFASINLTTVRAAINAKPFSGGQDAARTLTQWFNGIARGDQVRLIEAIQLGVTQGETIDQVVRRVVGTRANGFKDGVLSITRRHAETVVRTAINHVSNAARESMWEGNDDIIQALKWVATLDGRTSAICRARDGHLAPISLKVIPSGFPALRPPTARPPAHPNCRSLMIAILDIFGIADKIRDRPFVRDVRTGRRRQMDFRKEARDRDPDKWKRSTPQERNALIRQEKVDWSTRNVGRVPADVTYGEWLIQQPHSFQDQVLGQAKGKLFRTGRVKVDQFVDRRGNELTLDQLRQTKPEAFTDAGI